MIVVSFGFGGYIGGNFPAVFDCGINDTLDGGADWCVTDGEDFFDRLPRAGRLPVSFLNDVLRDGLPKMVSEPCKTSEACAVHALASFGAQRDVIAEHLDCEGALTIGRECREPVMRRFCWNMLAVIWLASQKASSFVTGQNIVVDGGFISTTI